LALLYIKIDDLNTALEYYRMIFDLPYELKKDELYRLYLNYGAFLYDHLQQKDSVLYYYDKSLENLEKTNPDKLNTKAIIYQAYGEYYLRENDVVLSLSYFQKALGCISVTFVDSGFLSNPELETVSDIGRMYRILKLKAQALHKYYLKYNDLDYLKSSLAVSQQCLQLINRIRYRITSEGSQFSISSSERDAYTYAIQTAYQLYSVTNDPVYLDEAFQINESSKAFVLMSHLRNQKAMEFGNIPENILAKENDLNRKLSFYSEQILQEKNKRNQDLTKLATWEKMLSEYNLEYDKLMLELEKNFPSYYDLKYRTEYISPSEVQRKLSRNDALVEYSLADSFLYTFIITKDKSILTRHIVGNNLEKDCNELYRIITTQNFSKNVQETYDNYTVLAHKLYTQLIAPFEKDLENKNLIIVADKEISYLPFDALLTEKVTSSGFDYRNLPYMIHKYSVGFTYSATLHFSHTARKNVANKEVLAFAPTYFNLMMNAMPTAGIFRQEDEFNLIMLPGIREEVRKIAKEVKTNVQIDYNATESNFKKMAADYEVLHLAMHTILNDENPMYSRMAFTQRVDSTEDGFLYAYEVYNMQVNAKMVVLSSCSSGFGKLQEGEGMQSLARSFSYAGCPSIVMSLWEVADFSTADLMTDFYKYLAMGYPKHEALRLSKLQFITGADHLRSNPFFWSSFIVLGDTSQIYREHKSMYYLMILPLIIFPALQLLRRRNMRRKHFAWAYAS
jgi:CHAT domain-containing protein